MNITQVPAKCFTKGRTYEGITYPVRLIVEHWQDGTLASTDRVFTTGMNNTSAHYGIGADGTVHQYVSENDTAYGAGDWFVNLQCINIEHEGAPGIDITDACYNASIALHKDIAARHGLDVAGTTTIRTNNGTKTLTVLCPHKAVRATECPGTLSIQRIRDGVLTENVLTDAKIVPVVQTCHVTVSSVYLRHTPEVKDTNHSILNGKPDRIVRGGACDYDSVVEGESVEGNNLWLHKPDGLFVWSGGTDYKPREI